ncbi:5031_t:CDS:2 [Scutellospora calospora]|uniref:5031_t:CDS:1 n=1 Tax=Scutellospora calospora TaxID=85575 RepID=A0ACA9L1E9_9GLOM|nr:5031_t:CDS:2 [Scutellospora calospora]
MKFSSQDTCEVDIINYINILDSTYLNSDQEYALLDNESNCSFTDQSFEIPRIPTTDSSRNENIYSDIFSNKVVYELVLDYFKTLSNNNEIQDDINWLSSDLDKLTDTESSCSFPLSVEENEVDYEIKENEQSNNNIISQCIITELVDDELKHYKLSKDILAEELFEAFNNFYSKKNLQKINHILPQRINLI